MPYVIHDHPDHQSTLNRDTLRYALVDNPLFVQVLKLALVKSAWDQRA